LALNPESEKPLARPNSSKNYKFTHLSEAFRYDPLIMKWMLTFLLTVGLAHAAPIKTKTSDYLKSEIEASLNLLPLSFLASVQKAITIKEKPLKSDSKMSENLCDLPDDIEFGRTVRNTITISSQLVNLAKNSTQSFDCGHGSFKQLLTAVIIHELTHIKDNAEKISIDPDFQRIVGMKKVQKRSKKRLMNYNAAVSPDAYEFKNLEESLAVNVEFLILDPEFECRKPATANFLSAKLGIELKGECAKNDKILIQSAFLEDNYQTAVSLDLKKIYQVHYLFAGQGEALMSRWGHAMFRIVICAPFREVPGPECLEDISHHLVLSYRASMNDLSVNYLKGMMGQYHSQLFIMRYFEVQQEYTKFGLRDLFSVPLKMTENQKKDFIDLTLERYWTYQGKYYFLDNNCGTETVKHLAVALSEEESRLIGSITPHKIYKDIVKESNNLTSGQVLVVKSMSKEYEETYRFIQSNLPGLFKEKKFKKFLSKTTSRERFEAYERLNLEEVENPQLRKQLVMKINHLERYLSSKFIMGLPSRVMDVMEKNSSIKEEVLQMNESMNLLTTQPWEVINSNYGVPTEYEVEEELESFLIKRRHQVVELSGKQLEQIQQILGEKYFSYELEELEGLRNITTLIRELILQSL